MSLLCSNIQIHIVFYYYCFIKCIFLSFKLSKITTWHADYIRTLFILEIIYREFYKTCGKIWFFKMLYNWMYMNDRAEVLNWNFLSYKVFWSNFVIFQMTKRGEHQTSYDTYVHECGNGLLLRRKFYFCLKAFETSSFRTQREARHHLKAPRRILFNCLTAKSRGLSVEIKWNKTKRILYFSHVWLHKRFFLLFFNPESTKYTPYVCIICKLPAQFFVSFVCNGRVLTCAVRIDGKAFYWKRITNYPLVWK